MRMAMYAKGVQIYCAPTADSRPTWASSMQHGSLKVNAGKRKSANRRPNLPGSLIS